LRKILDAVIPVRCAIGHGVIREEVWVDGTDEVVRYNLAFINHFLCSVDNGRVLGYDNRHGIHHRHACGAVERFIYERFDLVAERFLEEVTVLRREKR
jgi:hypothetical protein